MIIDPPWAACLLENLLVFLLTSFSIVSCRWSGVPLRIQQLHVPRVASAGDSVVLRCRYELGGETLYAVKWYKDAAEFFRFVPASDPPLKSFPRHGVDVDMSRSDHAAVVLRNLSLDSFGNYTCQVSTDAPHFRCVQTTRPLQVVVPPSDGPVLTEDKSAYELGDNVSILCNSGRAKPAPELRWYINDQLAHSELSDQETVVYPDSLESSSLALRFHLGPEVVHDGKVVLKCVSSQHHVRAVATREILAIGVTQTEIGGPLILAAVLISIVLQTFQTMSAM